MKCFFLSTLFLRSAFAFFYLDNEPEIDFEELWSKVIYEENLKSEVEDQKAQNSDNNPLLSSHDSPVSKRSMDDDPALVRKAKKSRANPDVDTNFTTNEPDYSFLPPVNAGSIISTPQQNDYPTTLTTLTVDNFDDTLHPLSRLITTPLENPADAIPQTFFFFFFFFCGGDDRAESVAGVRIFYHPLYGGSRKSQRK